MIVLMILAGLLVALAQLDALGPVGRRVNEGLTLVFGVGRVAIPVLLIGLGVILALGRVELERARFTWGVCLALVSVSGLGDVIEGRPGLGASLAHPGRAGGWLGVLVGGTLARFIGPGGALAALLAVLVIAVMIGTSIGLVTLLKSTGAALAFAGRHFVKWWSTRPTSTTTDDAAAELDDQGP
ncbi:MAG: DNA translocase FtsK 4TM domain-containing protein, partial [Acidobacteriota bacterium]|nr:DNA translocase FtsK 4TM domain-containing protein [Acidobacteriota bacterium]